MDTSAMAQVMIQRLQEVGCKTALRLAELAVTTKPEAPLQALEEILDDFAGDELSAQDLCQIVR
jgi:hypothetical protein